MQDGFLRQARTFLPKRYETVLGTLFFTVQGQVGNKGWQLGECEALSATFRDHTISVLSTLLSFYGNDLIWDPDKKTNISQIVECIISLIWFHLSNELFLC